MLFKNTSPITGEENEMELPITVLQLEAWRNGAAIQVAMPQLSPNQREFIISGIMPDEWEALFGGEEEDEV